MYRIVIACGMLIALGVGCAENMEIMERQANSFETNVVKPMVVGALENGVEGFGLQAGAQAINPTYKVTVKGMLVTGFEGEATVGMEGVSGQAQIHADADTPATKE